MLKSISEQNLINVYHVVQEQCAIFEQNIHVVQECLSIFTY